MRFNKTYVDNEFKFLPFVGECNEQNWKEKVIINAKKEKLEEFQSKIVELIISKEDWNKKIYSGFKTSLIRIKPNDLNYCASSILKILSLSNEKITIELNKFSSKQDFYPFVDRIKDPNTKKYNIIEKEICIEDSFIIVSELIKKIHSHISSVSSKFLWANENIYISMNFIARLLDGKELELKEKLLENYDKEFGYLKEFAIFKDIYFNYREDYLNIMLTSIVYHVSIIRTHTGKNIDAYSYIKSKRIKE